MVSHELFALFSNLPLFWKIFKFSYSLERFIIIRNILQKTLIYYYFEDRFKYLTYVEKSLKIAKQFSLIIKHLKAD